MAAETPKSIWRPRWIAIFAVTLSGGIVLWFAISSARRRADAPYNMSELTGFSFDAAKDDPTQVPESIRSLDGTRIAVNGWMWAPDAISNRVSHFDLVPPLPSEQFHPAQVQQYLKCRARQELPFLADEATATGVFHIKIVREDNKITQLFSMDVDTITPRRGY